DSRPPLDAPTARRELASQEPQEAGLPRAVDPDQPDPVTRTQPPGHPVEDPALAEGQRYIYGLEHLVAESRRREPQQLRPVTNLRLVGDQRVRRLDPELRLRRPRRRSPSQPGELLAHQRS